MIGVNDNFSSIPKAATTACKTSSIATMDVKMATSGTKYHFAQIGIDKYQC
jgi:hypothetical protein